MGLDCSVKAVIGFPIKLNDIAMYLMVPTCVHPERIGAVFCPVCGIRVGVNRKLCLRDGLKPIDWSNLDGITIGGVGLISRCASEDDRPDVDELWLCGIELATADVMRTTRAAEVEIDSITECHAKVLAAHEKVPGSPSPKLYLLPDISY